MHKVGGGQLPASAHILPGGTLSSLEARDIGLHLQPVLELSVLAVQPEGALNLLEGLYTGTFSLDVLEEAAVQLEAFSDGGGHLAIGLKLLFAKVVVLK